MPYLGAYPVSYKWEILGAKVVQIGLTEHGIFKSDEL